jgi:hypothetical protein
LPKASNNLTCQIMKKTILTIGMSSTSTHQPPTYASIA